MSAAGETFRAERIDHVELFVPDRYRAAEWYRRVLGLEIVPETEAWAADPGGPLMISSDGGRTKLALFEGTPQGERETAGFHRVAFRTGSAGFLEFLARLADVELHDHTGGRLTADLAVDHDRAYSIYFSDPWGHRLELTTYDHAETRRAIETA